MWYPDGSPPCGYGRGMRRHGAVELLLVLPDGSKSLVPAAWTDAKASGADGEGVMATLAAWTTPPHSPLR